jgi:hypothetical protein
LEQRLPYWLLDGRFVAEKVFGICFHIHIPPASIWSHNGRAKENAYAAPKQAPKIIATAKSNCPLLQSCGRFKTLILTKRETKLILLFIGEGRRRQSNIGFSNLVPFICKNHP